MKKNALTHALTVRFAPADVKAIDALVRELGFTKRADAIRYAIRRMRRQASSSQGAHP